MKFIKNLFWLFLIILVLYIVWLFIYTKEVKQVWDDLWLKDFNNFVLNFKWKIDELQDINVENKIKEIENWVEEFLDTGTIYAKDLKWKLDKIRKWAEDLEKTYNEVKTQIDDTTKNLKEIWNKINETKNTINDATNIFN